jgi:hypothetical protein
MVEEDFLKEIDWDLINELSFPSNEKLEELNTYFNTTKCLPHDQYIKWKILKKAMTQINTNFKNSHFGTNEIQHWIGINSVIKSGLGNEIRANLILATE